MESEVVTWTHAALKPKQVKIWCVSLHQAKGMTEGVLFIDIIYSDYEIELNINIHPIQLKKKPYETICLVRLYHIKTVIVYIKVLIFLDFEDNSADLALLPKAFSI